MRWPAYFILAYVTLGLQIGLAPYLRYRGAPPNLVLLAVVFIAMHAPRDAALLGAFCLGVLQDLVTQQPPGLFALSYGLVALFVTGAQQVVYREHPLTLFALALAGGAVTALLVLLHGWLYAPVPSARGGAGTAAAALPAVRPSAAVEFTRVLYTAALAPVVLFLLQRARRVFGFQAARRKPWWRL